VHVEPVLMLEVEAESFILHVRLVVKHNQVPVE
jgi:hypothetical protein